LSGSVRALLIRRLLQAVTVVAVVVTVTFFLIHLAPGDPLMVEFADPRVSQTVRQYWYHVYGFDQPVHVQFLRYLSGMLHGQLGYSVPLAAPVSTVLARALPNSLMLAGSALALSFGVGVIIALIQVGRQGSISDRTLGAVSLALYCTPGFWLAQVALLVFAYWIPIFPAGGIVDPVMHPYLGGWAAMVDRLRHLVLPVLALTAVSAAGVARFQRAALLDVAGEDYLRTARAKGVPERSVLVRHALRNAALPVISLFGLSLPEFLTGTVFVEKIFGWPGLGALAVDAVTNRDYPTTVACAIIASVAVATGSLVADVLYVVADPRLRRPVATPTITRT
jgi:peptide/nickel transport system permease protein